MIHKAQHSAANRISTRFLCFSEKLLSQGPRRCHLMWFEEDHHKGLCGANNGSYQGTQTNWAPETN
jgi:hypothetical protein